MTSFANKDGILITQNLIETIKSNKQYLSDLDGLIGDGDHGINMNKGFAKTGEIINESTDTLSSSFRTLSDILMNDIGGAMGPLYGSFFRAMFRASKNHENIDEKVFSEMLAGALEKIQDIGQAKVGDKTLVDTLAPAVEAFNTTISAGEDFASALEAMKAAAERGRDSTKDMVAKKGRSSRLGERSRGVLDAGATSCCLILSSLADSIFLLLRGKA